MASGYELLRSNNIIRNNAMLESLGIDGILKEKKQPMEKKECIKRYQKRQVAGTRSSKRIKLACSENITESKPSNVKKDIQYVDHRRDPLLDVVDKSGMSSTVVWDSKKKHQHLELSSSKRTVVTTGCAGYGAVLACGAITTNKADTKTAKSWSLEVLREGVGGFAIGISNANTIAPYKSMGNRPDSWMLEASGSLKHNRKEELVWKEGYGSGDLVEVMLSGGGQLSFSINKVSFDVDITVPPGKYVLCCQPYMGGAAKLV